MSDETMRVGQQIADLCREGKNQEAIRELYADDIVSIEAMAMEDMPARMEGKEAILGKNQWWSDNHEVHSGEVLGPFPHGDRFILLFRYDVTQKASGQRFQMEEAGLFTVANGKVAQEEFFYDMG